MSITESNQLFESQYLNNTDNIFEAINHYASDANKLCNQTQNRLNKSEALTSILTKKLPDDISKRRVVEIAEHTYADKYIKQALADIDDGNIRKHVYESLIQSQYTSNLVYVYGSGLSSSEKSRIRILCNMIWSSLYPRKEPYYATD